jgi:hypothetical protein
VVPRTLASRSPSNASLLAPVPKRWHPGIGALIFSFGASLPVRSLSHCYRVAYRQSDAASALRERRLLYRKYRFP